MAKDATNSSKMNAIMLDMEFLNTTQDAAILQIAIVPLNTVTLEISPDTFFIEVDPDDCMAKGMTVSADTLRWWINNDINLLRDTFSKEGRYKHSLAIAMFKVGQFISAQGKPDELTILQVGDLDSQILQTGYRLVAGDVTLPNGLPWRPWRVKCVRALRDEFGHLVPEPDVAGKKHNALYDALYQAQQYVSILKLLREATTKPTKGIDFKALNDATNKKSRTPQPGDDEL